MTAPAEIKRVQDLQRAVQLDAVNATRERWTRAELQSHQRVALRRLLAHARTNSPFYRDLYAGIEPDAALSTLPVVEKGLLMERWDEVVTDRRLRLEEAQEHVEALTDDAYLHDEFRIVSTGGSSRVPGIYAFDREGWAAVVANMIRSQRITGALPRPNGSRLAIIGPLNAMRAINTRIVSLLALADAEETTLRLDICRPVAELVTELNGYKPTMLLGYPSMISLLAGEQLDERLRIAPTHVAVGAEPLTSAMRDRIRTAWGAEPFDIWGITESSGVIGIECGAHRGLHLAEDVCIVEVVDEDNHPVPDGEIGARILITNLVNPVMPIIRYAVSDRVALDTSSSCPCGRAMRLVRAVDGRSDDILTFPAAAGGTVQVHPLAWSPLAGDHSVAEFRIVHDHDALHVDVVLRNGETPDHVEHLVRELLRARGVSPAQAVLVRAHDHLERSSLGKLKLVSSRPPLTGS